MGLLDLFRPRWKHSNPTVRAEAIKDFSADDLPRLAQVARHDSDARVRRIALKKISDTDLLGELAQHDPDEGLRRDAAEKAGDLLLAVALGADDEERSLSALSRLSTRLIVDVACKAARPAVRKAALGKLDEEKSILEVARRGSDAATRQAALGRLKSEEALRDLLLSDVSRELALQALERIKSPSLLSDIAQRAKNKALRSAARDKLGPAEASAPSSKAKTAAPATSKSADPSQERRELLCQKLEIAAKSSDPADFADGEELLALTRREWQAVAGEPTSALRKRFDRAASRFAERRDQLVKKQLKREPAPIAVHVAPPPPPPRPERSPEELAADKAAADKAAAERAAKAAADKAAADEAQQRVEAARTRREAERKLRDAEHAEKLQAESERRAAEEKRRESEQTANASRVEEQCDKLEKLGQAETLKPKQVDQQLRQAHDVMVASNPLPRDRSAALRKRYDAARATLVIKLQELREREDWERWANLPRLEALCQKVEALAAAQEGGAAASDVAALLKTLQSEWKAVGPAPKDKSELLWQRFKSKGDEIYDRLRAGSAEERTANLAKKEELCQKIEALLAGLAESPDWKAISEQQKALQAEWKSVGQVPSREQGEALWQRFKAAADKVYAEQKTHYAGLDEERGENLKRKEALCQQVEALIYSTDWREAGDLIKGYQADWKAVGPAPRAEQEALWQRFRGACDKFFERRQAAFKLLDDERLENQKKKELLIEQAAALCGKADMDQELAESEIKRLQGEWKRLGPAPKETAEELWQRFRKSCDEIFGRGRNFESVASGDEGAKWSNKLPLVAALAKLQAEPAPTTASASPTASAEATASAGATEPSAATASASAVSPSAEARAHHSWEHEAASAWEDIDREVSGNTPPSSTSKPEV